MNLHQILKKNNEFGCKTGLLMCCKAFEKPLLDHGAWYMLKKPHRKRKSCTITIVMIIITITVTDILIGWFTQGPSNLPIENYCD